MALLAVLVGGLLWAAVEAAEPDKRYSCSDQGRDDIVRLKQILGDLPVGKARGPVVVGDCGEYGEQSVGIHSNDSLDSLVAAAESRLGCQDRRAAAATIETRLQCSHTGVSFALEFEDVRPGVLGIYATPRGS